MRDFVLPNGDPPPPSADWTGTRGRVATYFDATAMEAWARLTSEAPVSRIRATVRAGRDAMRATMLSRLPADLQGARVLDAGCGTGAMTSELAKRGAEVLAVDISPNLVGIAEERLPQAHRKQVTFVAGDMLAPDLGRFDHVVAMDSLLYYSADDIAIALDRLAARTSCNLVFTVAPRTPLLLAMLYAGRLFPRGDRSPVMQPHSPRALRAALRRTGQIGPLEEVSRISRGFYISACLDFRP